MKLQIFLLSMVICHFAAAMQSEGITPQIKPLLRTKSCELKRNPDEDMLPHALAFAKKVPSPRGQKGCLVSPRQEGRARTSSLSKETTAEFFTLTHDCSK